MGISHDQAVVSHFGHPLRRCAAVHGYTFADSGMVADYCYGILSFELKVLRNAGNYGSGEDVAVFADAGTFHDCDIAADMCAFTYLDILVDGDKRLNHHTGVNFCGRMYICKRLFHSVCVTCSLQSGP